MKPLMTVAAAGVLVLFGSKGQADPNFGESEIDRILGEMSLSQKLEIIRAQTPDFMATPAIPALGIPAIITVDATQGVRQSPTEGIKNSEPSTLFASVVMLAATWDRDLAERMGKGVALEAANKGLGAQVLLAPGLNIHRSPLGGRNSEYFSEDPFLTGKMGASYIRGVQSMGVAACAKHFACNNQETERNRVNVEVDERALREIYLPAFEMAVKEGNVWSIMNSYNRVRGEHASVNAYLLTDVLRGSWGFDGCVISDWGAVHSARSYAAGNDLDMHMGTNSGTKPEEMAAALKRGEVSLQDIDRAARNVLRLAVRSGAFISDRKKTPSVVNSPEHDSLSLEIARKGIVLLKNENQVLPLDSAKVGSIALIGPAAEEMQLGAEGSPHVTPSHPTSLKDGLRNILGDSVKVNVVPIETKMELLPSSIFHDGDLKGEYFDNKDLRGEPVLTRRDKTIDFNWSREAPSPLKPGNEFSVRWTGTFTAPQSGAIWFAATTDDGCRLFVDDKEVIERWKDGSSQTVLGAVPLEKGKSYSLRFEYFQGGGDAVANLKWAMPGSEELEEASEAARSADVAIFCATTKGFESEGNDRPNMYLPFSQDTLISAVAGVNPRTIVILNTGTPVDVRTWLPKVPAVIEAWFPGQKGGLALAEILFGMINPSGKLPDTWGAKREDYPDANDRLGDDLTQRYSEGLYVGYRWFDKKKIEPVFPFGYGLSYTTFSYGPIRLSLPAISGKDGVEISVDVTNTGKVAGDEVVQLYVNETNPHIDRPIQELKGFARLSIPAGATRTAKMKISVRDLAYFDTAGMRWKADAGSYNLGVGASSKDIRGSAELKLAADYFEEISKARRP